MSKMNSRHVVACLAVLVLLSSCGSSGPPSSPADSAVVASENSTDSLTETMTQFVGDASGGVEVLRERSGIREHTAVGTATNDGQQLTPGSVFRVGSVSKTFVAVMVLQLVDEGSVDLETPLEAYLPDTVVGAGATVRQLLSHQSGIPNYTDQPAFFADVLADRSRRMTPPDILAFIADVPTGPAGQFAYSNTNYILLGQLIEALDGSDLNTSLERRITGPAGLEHTTFDTGDGPDPTDIVGGWSQTGDTGDPAAMYASIASSAWSAGSLISTADDLATFLAALAGGQFVSTDSLAAMTDTGSTGYGLGLFAVGFSPTQSGYGHSGSIPGFTSTMAIDPATGDTLVILSNNDELVADQLAPRILSAE